MKHSVLKATAAFFVGSILLNSCKKDDPQPVNEEELITTLVVSLKDVATGFTSTFIFKDPDGEGGNGPTQFDEINMEAGKEYDCTLSVLNESVSPAEDITEEIMEEDVDHQFYFTPSGSSASVTTTDIDAVGLPVGLESNWDAGAAGTGTMKITLKHKPGEKAAGDTIAVGETDIEITFTTNVN